MVDYNRNFGTLYGITKFSDEINKSRCTPLPLRGISPKGNLTEVRTPSGAPRHLPQGGENSLKVSEISLMGLIFSPPGGSARRARGS
jgi:hypothetical protein